MDLAIDTSAFDRATDPVIRLLNPAQVHQIVDYHADDALQNRIDELAEKANDGELTSQELAEYEGYAQANQFVAILQAQARRQLSSPTSK